MRCNNCGHAIQHEDEVAASIEDLDGLLKFRWCFPCWDNDERAVEQYRSFGSPTHQETTIVNLGNLSPQQKRI